MLLRLEGFKYATSLDLNMGYYHIVLTPYSSKLCTIVTPWAKYEYLRLPMGLCNSPDIFQEQMSELMYGFDFIRVYLDDLLVISKGDYIDHLSKLEKVFSRLAEAGLRINGKKSFFLQPELEYLGYLINQNGIQPVPKKVKAMLALEPPKTRKQLRSFIGMINFYRDLWRHRSELLAPLSCLTSINVPFKWTDIEQKAFEMIKQVVSQQVLLTYPNFNIPFHIYTDASKYQLGSVIMQENSPIAFYSRKLNPAQFNYTTSERELLSIVETLKEYRNILFGHKIIVYTDHKNLTYKNSSTEHVTCWRLLLEEFNPEFNDVLGSSNIIADALSRLPIVSCVNLYLDLFTLGIDDLPSHAFPLTFKTLMIYQIQDPSLLAKVNFDPLNH